MNKQQCIRLLFLSVTFVSDTLTQKHDLNVNVAQSHELSHRVLIVTRNIEILTFNR